MERALHNLLHFSLLAVILAAIVWALVGSSQSGIYHNPLAVLGLGLIGLGLCKSQRERKAAVALQKQVTDKNPA